MSIFLLPANKVCEGYVFIHVILFTGGACMAGRACIAGEHVCQGGMHAMNAPRHYKIWSVNAQAVPVLPAAMKLWPR